MKRHRITTKILIFGLFLGCFSQFVCFGDSPQQFYPAQVKDISDRKYESAVIELLDNAEESIVISMYIMQDEEKGPVRLLIKDLEEALDRGVSVEIYLNTQFKSTSADKVIAGKIFDILRKKGAKIFAVTHSIRLHDKLIIVDKRYVVEGSTNWSVSALKDNYESSVLIDSPELAIEKLVRLRRFPLEGESPQVKRIKTPERLLVSENSFISLDKNLLEDKNLFPRMITKHDQRAMDTYLLLKAYEKEQAVDKFFVPLENLALELNMPGEWSNLDKRRQVIKVLKKLRDRYKLIDVNFGHGKDAWVEMKEVSGDTFELKTDFFDPSFFSALSPPAKFIILIKVLLQEEGSSIDAFTQVEIAKRFHIDVQTVSKGIKETSILSPM